MEKIEIYKQEIDDLNKQKKNIKKEINDIRVNIDGLAKKQNTCSAVKLYSFILTICSAICFLINPLSLPFILTGVGFLALSSIGISVSSIKRSKYSKFIDNLSCCIKEKTLNIDKIDLEINKRYSRINKLNQIKNNEKISTPVIIKHDVKKSDNLSLDLQK